MKHWMAVAIIGVMATGLSLASIPRTPDAVRTPGLPSGWSGEGIVAGVDEIAVERPRDGGPAELVIVKHDDTLAGTPLSVYQAIDATPWRGHTMVLSFHSRVQLEPDVMRRTQGQKVVELHLECDGARQPGRGIAVDASWHTRRWVENNLTVKVAADTTRCVFGVASLVKAEIRLSRMRIKERPAFRVAKPWPEWLDMPKGPSIFPAGVAATTTPLNLELKQ